MSRTEVRGASGESSPWDVVDGDGVWSLLFNGWVVCEVRRANTGETFCSKVRQRVPDFVLVTLPDAVSTAVRRRTDAFTPNTPP